MAEPDHFPREMRTNAAAIRERQPYTADMLQRAATEVERLRQWVEDHPYSELDMDMHVEAVTKELRADKADLLAALKPFAEPHAMGDNYVKFAPRLIEAARAAIAKADPAGGRQ